MACSKAARGFSEAQLRSGTALTSGMAPRPTRHGWSCSACKATNGAGYGFCWKCWASKDGAESDGSGSTASVDITESEDVAKAKLRKLRDNLLDLRGRLRTQT